MTCEDAIKKIIEYTEDDIIISTTGKASRELFELRERMQKGHDHDFLTVGSMGHASSIAYGTAIQRLDRRIWCIDGDGAAIMHMGAMAVIGRSDPKPHNLVHIIMNNGAHESVGGMPTSAGELDLEAIAKGSGYEAVYGTDNLDELDGLLQNIRKDIRLTLLEIKCAIGARADLGRPTECPKEIKEKLMASGLR